MEEIKIIDEQTVPNEGDPFVLAIISVDESGTIQWISTLNEPSHGMSEYFREDIENNGNLGDTTKPAGIYKAKFSIHSWRSYEGEWDSMMEMDDLTLLVSMEELEKRAKN